MEEKKSYKCKYCGEEFEKPLLLAHHVRSKHKRIKKREKKAAEKALSVEQINKTIEAIGILKGLQASANLTDEEKELLGEVITRVEVLISSR